MRQNILLRHHRGFDYQTSYLSRYEKVSRQNLSLKVTNRRTRTIQMRNRRVRKVTGRKNNATQDRAKRTITKDRNLSRKKK